MEFSPPFSRIDPALARQWAGWQPKEFTTPPGPPQGLPDPLPLERFDPGAKPFSSGEKAMDKAAVEALAEELDGLQNLFYADRRYKLLVLLQGTDTSGKDGTVRGVFGRMSALGVRAVGWKAPTETERAHDYLWRIHAQVPAAGETVVFNRSHYEDVLVPVVQGWITPGQHAQRLAHINDFERMLAETGTVTSSSCCTSAKTSSANACRPGWTTRPSTGNSRWATSRPASSGTTTSTPTPRCWPPRTRPGRRGPSCRPTPRPTAT